FFSSRRRHTRSDRDWSSDVCSSDLIFLGFGSEFTFWRIFPLALLGGWLGVLFMIPLRRQLIVKEHGALTFPEGTACADVLVAGRSEERRVGKGVEQGCARDGCMSCE